MASNSPPNDPEITAEYFRQIFEKIVEIVHTDSMNVQGSILFVTGCISISILILCWMFVMTLPLLLGRRKSNRQPKEKTKPVADIHEQDIPQSSLKEGELLEELPPVPKKFIKACDFDIDRARARWAATYEWRRRFQANDILRERQPEFSAIKSCHPHFFCGRGKSGNCVFYEKPGFIDFAVMDDAGLTVEAMVRHHIFLMEYCWQKLDVSEFGKLILVIDMRNTQSSQLSDKVTELLKSLAELLTNHYPETCQAILFVNCPDWFGLDLEIVQSLMSKSVKGKATAHGEAATLGALLELIDADQIPREYGGDATFDHLNPFEKELEKYVMEKCTKEQQRAHGPKSTTLETAKKRWLETSQTDIESEWALEDPSTKKAEAGHCFDSGSTAQAHLAGVLERSWQAFCLRRKIPHMVLEIKEDLARQHWAAAVEKEKELQENYEEAKSRRQSGISSKSDRDSSRDMTRANLNLYASSSEDISSPLSSKASVITVNTLYAQLMEEQGSMHGDRTVEYNRKKQGMESPQEYGGSPLSSPEYSTSLRFESENQLTTPEQEAKRDASSSSKKKREGKGSSGKRSQSQAKERMRLAEQKKIEQARKARQKREEKLREEKENENKFQNEIEMRHKQNEEKKKKAYEAKLKRFQEAKLKKDKEKQAQAQKELQEKKAEQQQKLREREEQAQKQRAEMEKLLKQKKSDPQRLKARQEQSEKAHVEASRKKREEVVGGLGVSPKRLPRRKTVAVTNHSGVSFWELPKSRDCSFCDSPQKTVGMRRRWSSVAVPSSLEQLHRNQESPPSRRLSVPNFYSKWAQEAFEEFCEEGSFALQWDVGGDSERAATKIQSLWRGHKIYQLFQKLKECNQELEQEEALEAEHKQRAAKREMELEASMSQKNAAVEPPMTQAELEEGAAKREMELEASLSQNNAVVEPPLTQAELEERAATIIQSHYRGMQIYQLFRYVMKEKKEFELLEKRFNMAVLIQKTWRGTRVKKKFEKAKERMRKKKKMKGGAYAMAMKKKPKSKTPLRSNGGTGAAPKTVPPSQSRTPSRPSTPRAKSGSRAMSSSRTSEKSSSSRPSTPRAKSSSRAMSSSRTSEKSPSKRSMSSPRGTLQNSPSKISFDLPPEATVQEKSSSSRPSTPRAKSGSRAMSSSRTSEKSSPSKQSMSSPRGTLQNSASKRSLDTSRATSQSSASEGTMDTSRKTPQRSQSTNKSRTSEKASSSKRPTRAPPKRSSSKPPPVKQRAQTMPTRSSSKTPPVKQRAQSTASKSKSSTRGGDKQSDRGTPKPTANLNGKKAPLPQSARDRKEKPDTYRKIAIEGISKLQRHFRRKRRQRIKFLEQQNFYNHYNDPEVQKLFKQSQPWLESLFYKYVSHSQQSSSMGFLDFNSVFDLAKENGLIFGNCDRRRFWGIIGDIKEIQKNQMGSKIEDEDEGKYISYSQFEMVLAKYSLDFIPSNPETKASAQLQGVFKILRNALMQKGRSLSRSKIDSYRSASTSRSSTPTRSKRLSIDEEKIREDNRSPLRGAISPSARRFSTASNIRQISKKTTFSFDFPETIQRSQSAPYNQESGTNTPTRHVTLDDDPEDIHARFFKAFEESTELLSSIGSPKPERPQRDQASIEDRRRKETPLPPAKTSFKDLYLNQQKRKVGMPKQLDEPSRSGKNKGLGNKVSSTKSREPSSLKKKANRKESEKRVKATLSSTRHKVKR